MKKLLLSALLVAGMFPLTSSAACTQYGVVQRVTAYDDGYGVYNYIYMRNTGLTNYWWYTRTTDDELVEMAVTALTTETRVAIGADAASCPTTGDGRYMGNLNYLVISP